MKNKIRIEFDKIPKAFLAATHEVVQKKLFELGYSWLIERAKVSNCCDFLWAERGFLYFGDSRNDDDGDTSPENVYVMPGDFDKMVEYLSKKDYRDEIKLNSEYNATVTQEGVKVGCQSFTFEAIEGLYESVQKAKKAKTSKNIDYFVTQDPIEACQDFAWLVKGNLVYSVRCNPEGKINIEKMARAEPSFERIQKDLVSGVRIKMTEKEFIARAKAWLRR